MAGEVERNHFRPVTPREQEPQTVKGCARIYVGGRR